MIKEYISLNIGFEGANWNDEDEIKRRYNLVKEFTAPFGIKNGFAGLCDIPLDMPDIDVFLDKLEQYITKKKSPIKNNCYYTQQYEGESEWYKYQPFQAIDTEYQGSIMTCKAANIPANLEIAAGHATYTFVSEKFKKIVEDNSLTGIDFLWCNDIGRFAPAKQWYQVILKNFIGRGIDCPWVDIDSKHLYENEKYQSELGRISVNIRFSSKALRNDAPIQPNLKRFLSMCDKVFITFPEHFLREYLPDTDFAFGFFPGWHGLFINKKTKDILAQNHLIYEHLAEPVVILDKLPEGAVQLDGREPLPVFEYGSRRNIGELTLMELKQLHEEAKIIYDKKPKPPKKITIKQAFSLINSEKRRRPDDFAKRLGEKEIFSRNIMLPSNWVELLKKSNGGFLSDECELIPYSDIEEFTKEKLRQGKDFFNEYPENRISIAKAPDGDWYDLVIYGDCSTDCHIVRVTHEGGDILREWDCIANFIYEIILENE